MKIVLLNVEQAQSIYRSQMVRDFPESELKPFASVQGMMTRGLYEPLAFYDEAGALMAYAWQAVLPQCRNVLLDYFAVLPQYRGSGVGTAVLKELAAYYAPRKQSLIIECEHPAEAPEPAVARRRIGFYLRAGAHALLWKAACLACGTRSTACPRAGLPKMKKSTAICRNCTAPWCRNPITAAT